MEGQDFNAMSEQIMTKTDKVVRISDIFRVTTGYLLKDQPQKQPDKSQ